MTNFECGGYSIGISCSLLLADLVFKGNFLQKWAKIHNNIILSKNNVPQKPIFYLPDLKKDGRPVTGSSPSKNRGQTFIFNIAATESSTIDNTLALLCVEEAEGKLGSSKMASEFPFFMNESIGNVFKVEKCSKLQNETTGVNPKLSQLGITPEGWDDIGAEDVEFLDGNQPVHVSHWIGSVSGGLVWAIPPFLDDGVHEGVTGGKILVTVPNVNAQV